jgi:hypothetical protein
MTHFVWLWTAIGVLVLPATLYLTAPFGRHVNRRFGPMMDNRLGWLFMESPALWWFTICFLAGDSRTAVSGVLWGFWIVHYLNRGLIFPFRLRTTGKRIPVLIVVCGFAFQMVNGALNGRELSTNGLYDSPWLTSPNFVLGAGLFVGGWIVNICSDEVLLALRRPGETGYRIPEGWFFRWLSCPNFTGEMVQWCGWAIMCWNPAALSFAVWTIANLLPRALAHHRWYRTEFADYPKTRKAVIPYIL